MGYTDGQWSNEDLVQCVAKRKKEPKKKKPAVDRDYSLSLSDYSMTQLVFAAPFALLDYAVSLNRDVTKEDLQYVMAEPDGTPNLRIVRDAMQSLDSSDIPFLERAAVRLELLQAEKNIVQEIEENPPVQMARTNLDIGGFETAIRASFWGTEKKNDSFIATDKIQELSSAIMAGAATATAYAEPSHTPTSAKSGSLSTDLRPYPNFEKLGIDRAAGPATGQEVAIFKGQTKSDGSPVGPEDFFSVGCLLMSNDLMEDRYVQVSALELARLGTMLEYRAKGSDANHDFEAEDCHFRLVNPKVGTDPDTMMHQDSALLGKEPYTALIARAIFPITQNDPDQTAAIEKVRRGLIQNLSPAFGANYYTCGGCGEIPILETQKMDGKVTALKIKIPEDREALDMMEYCGIVIRTPNKDVAGGFIYTEAMVMASSDGIISLEAIDDPGIDKGSVLMVKMQMIPMLFSMAGGQAPKYCQIHGLQGATGRGGCKVVAMATNVFCWLSTAEVTAGAFSDARFVLDPSVTH